ncbi:hypothetical protein EZV62_006972 [Acer yangbiense]|uniref:Uncharacterized protein n=1 Tax=Acer yangbiense TaxID=1000413 RepID=A0A5C7I983_9ROSI|nr:hypothetical protein EZV62_006972 [Acer yangbiense]
MYSAAVSSQLRGDPPATGNLSPIKFEARREGLLSLQSLADSVLKSIESCTDFGTLYEDPKVRCKKKAMVLFVKMIISSALQDMLLTMQDMFLHSMKLGIFLLATPKGLQGTKHRSSEAGEVLCSEIRHSKDVKERYQSTRR